MTNFDGLKSKQNPEEITTGASSLAEKLATGLEIQLNADLGSEAGEHKIPKVKIHIFFGTHGTEQEAELLRGPIQKADVYIPELASWDPGFKYALEDVVRGRKTPEVIMQERGINPDTDSMFGFTKRQLEILYKSNKLIALADVPYTNNISQRFSDTITSEIQRPTLRKLVQVMRIKLKERSEAHSDREDFMIIQLEKEMKAILADNPELMKKKQVNILMFLGAAHTRVYHILKKGRKNVSREFGKMPQFYGYRLEAMRRFQFGKEVNFELGTRVLMEEYLTDLFFKHLIVLTEDIDKIIYYIRKIVEKFNVEEIRKIIENETPGALLSTALKQKRIYQPTAETDLDSFINKVV